MDKFPETYDPLDDKLSEFTDLLLSGGDDAKMQNMMNDDELIKLQRAAIRMKGVARMAQPGPVASARIRSRLLKEWKEQVEHPKHLAFFKNLFAPISLPRFAMAGGLVALLLLSIVTFVVPVSPPLTGAAVMKLQAWAPLFILFGIILIIALFWYDRRN